MPKNDIKPKKSSWSPAVANFSNATSSASVIKSQGPWGSKKVEHRHFIPAKQCKNR